MRRRLSFIAALVCLAASSPAAAVEPAALLRAIEATSLDPSRAVRVRNVALQIGVADFERIFPDVGGYRYFLIDAPSGSLSTATALLEEFLGDQGFDVTDKSGKRYVSFAHGRDCIRRFGPKLVLDLYEKAGG